MPSLSRTLLLLLILGAPSVSLARVFNFKEARIAPYIMGTGSLSSLDQTAFDDSSGTDTVLDGESQYGYSGELGLLFRIGNAANLRLGAELYENRPVDGKGKNPSGAERFTLDSTVSAFNPNLTLEMIYSANNDVRFFLLLGGGYAEVTVENRYDMSSMGTTELGVSDFNEKLTGIGYSGHAGIGLETLFVDNVTFAANFGYRYLPIRELKYKSEVNTITKPSGAQAGDVALNHDGNNRTVNLSGVFIGVALRFYLTFL